MAHQSRDTRKLLELLSSLQKFPYDDPVWYLLKNVRGCLENNPNQVRRIAETLYLMTAEETVVRLEAAPKLNTQIGPMFGAWVQKTFALLSPKPFQTSKKGIFVLDASEESSKEFVQNVLGQSLKKRPDFIAKVDSQYVIGEAKWIGQPGGNQGKQVVEVLAFCKNQRGNVKRIGIVDGFPWSLYNRHGNLINDKVTVMIQETEYDVFGALLLRDYLEHIKKQTVG